MVSEDDVRRICLSLPGAFEKPYARMPGFRVRNKLFARIRDNPYALFVGVANLLEKEMLMTTEPSVYFQTPHYEGYPGVLVRLENIEFEAVEELLTEAWKRAASAKLVAEFEATRS